MNRPRKNYPITQDGYPIVSEELVTYLNEIDKYCDSLEVCLRKMRCQIDNERVVAVGKCLERIDKLDKAIDKACSMLATQSTSTDCWDFNECPFRNACNEKHNGGCNDSQKWKAWCMEDE